MDTLPRHIFVYGTLRTRYSRLPSSVRRIQPPQILQIPNRWLGVGTLAGYRIFNLGSYPGVIRCHSDTSMNSFVVGDVFEIDTSALSLLDEYEGISDRYERPHEYVRVAVHVKFCDGEGESKHVRCWVYVYNWSIPSNVVFIDSGDYVEYCEKRVTNGEL